MADYHAVLKRAIDALPDNSGAARRAVYQRARSAIVNQLKNYDPPLSPSAITTEQLHLEEAIRKVEADAARLTLGLGPQPAAKTSTGEPRSALTASTQGASQGAAQGSGPQAGSGEASRKPDEKPEPKSEPTPEQKPEPSLQQKTESAPKPGGESKSVVEPKPDAGSKPRGGFFAGLAAKASSKTARKDETVKRAPGEAVSWGAPGKDDTAGKATAGLTKDAGAPVDKASEASGAMAPTVTAGTKPSDTSDAPAAAGSAIGNPAVASPNGDRVRQPAPKMGAARRGQYDTAAAKPTRLPAIAAMIAALIVFGGLAAGVYSQRDAILGMIASLGTSAPSKPAGETAQAPVETPAGREDPDTKSSERLLSDGDSPAAPDARAVTTTRIVPPGEEGGVTTAAPSTDAPARVAAPEAQDSQPQETPAAETNAEPASGDTLATLPVIPGAHPPEQKDTGLQVSQRSILYEEGEGGDSAGSAAQGQVVWSTAREVAPGSEEIDTVLKANVVIPDRNISIGVTIRPNRDTSLPASHLIEIRFTLPPEFAGKGVANVPGLIMKTTEEARGDALVGASVRVDSGFFWVALSALEQEKQRNETLLRDRGWIDIPVLYDSGKRAILTLEKGTAGDRAVQLALDAWAEGG